MGLVSVQNPLLFSSDPPLKKRLSGAFEVIECLRVLLATERPPLVVEQPLL